MSADLWNRLPVLAQDILSFAAILAPALILDWVIAGALRLARCCAACCAATLEPIWPFSS
ncbi:MAG: hypothetical protein ACK5LJ_09110 [Paracoccus sp. (in: a-proteobacteria)]